MQTDNWHISKERSLKFAMLGYQGSGKTYYLGSLYSLKLNPGPVGFSVRGKDFTTIGRMEETYRILKSKQLGATFTTKDSESIDLIFKKGLEDLFNVTIIDLLSELTQPGLRVEETKSILKNTHDVDGIIITIKAPENYQELQNRIEELFKIKNLVKTITQKNKDIPIALILTQIDKLPQLFYIENEIIEKMKTIDLSSRIDTNSISKFKDLKSEIINSKVEKVLYTPYIIDLITNFNNNLNEHNSKYKVFPSTSVGFNTTLNSYSTFNPYGTGASFLWMIYSSILIKPILPNSNFRINQVKDEILYMLSSGQAYFETPL